METEKIEVEVDNLFLDLENPRTGTVFSQSEALGAIVRLSTRNFKNMMLSIKPHGLDPGDAFYLVQEDGDDFTVMDGNRRLAALKVLLNPNLLDGAGLPETIKRPLIRATEGFDGISMINCVLFESRPDAGEWIERRHGKGLEGEGRISWGSLEIQRFQKDPTIIDVIKFVEDNSTFSDAEWLRIKSAVERNTSTLRRFLESKAGIQYLGFIQRGESGGPAFVFDPKYIVDVLSQIFLDIANGDVNTRTHNKASEIEEYFGSLPAGLDIGGQKSRMQNRLQRP